MDHLEIIQVGSWKIEKVLECRGTYLQTEMGETLKNMEAFIESSGAHRVGPTVSATTAIHQDVKPEKFDVVIMIPIDSRIASTDKYRFMDEFVLESTIKVRHKGNPVGLKNAVDYLNEYIAKNKLKPISVSYNVAMQEAKTMQEINDMIIDIYVSVMPLI